MASDKRCRRCGQYTVGGACARHAIQSRRVVALPLGGYVVIAADGRVTVPHDTTRCAARVALWRA